MTSFTPQVPQVFLNGAVPFESQVAGHAFESGTNSVGLLKNASEKIIFKPLGKPQCAARERSFYESLEDTSNPDLILLKKLVPQYYGAVKMTVNGRELDFIKLKDLTYGMTKPCAMDIKIGKRTWDPLATAEKRAAEETKYSACKQNLGLCIPGFQVYNLQTGKLRRFGKEYGKSLDEKSFIDALKLFLNVDFGMCRSLVHQILCQLWAVQKWSRTQTSIISYSSSILLVYDAIRLKHFLKIEANNFNNTNGSRSLQIENIPSEINSKSHMRWDTKQSSPFNRSHLVHHNFDEPKLKDRANPEFQQEVDVNDDEDDQSWVRVKMIDFAHVFPSNDNSVDTNYLFGIENLVKIFENFLRECDL